MKKKKPAPILLATEFETGKRARSVQSTACALAEKLGTSLELIHAESLPNYPFKTSTYKPLIASYIKEAKLKLAAIAGRLSVPATSTFLTGEPARKILSLAAKRNAYEMVVVGTHGRTGLSRLVLGSVAEEVIRNARIPVLTVGPKAQEKVFFSSPKLTLLISTGLTPNSSRAEEYGVDLARRLGARVIFFHSLRESLHPVLQTAFSVPNLQPQIVEFYEDMKAAAVKQLSARAAKSSKKGVPATYELNDKILSASEGVLSAAEHCDASLIVMGTHGRTAVAGAFLGRTARDVILGADVPVITLHSKTK